MANLVDEGCDDFELGKLCGEVADSFRACNQVEEKNVVFGDPSCLQYLHRHNGRSA